MKKLLKLLIIIALIGIILFCLYKFVFNKNTKNQANKYSDLKRYLSDIYGVTFLIPEFDDINEADEQWLWENVNQYLWNHDDEYHEQNSQEYGYTYEDISKIVKILYGDDLKKQFPKGAISMRYNSYRDLYAPTAYSVSNYYSYRLDNISQNGNIFTISLYDYTILSTNSSGETTYMIYNNYEYLLNSYEGTPIMTISSLKDKQFENLLEQKDKLSHKILTIEFDEQTNLYHIKSCKYKETKPEDILSTLYHDMKMTFEIDSIDYEQDAIYTQDEILVENFDELSKIYTENSIDTYKNEMDLFVFKDDGQVYITAGDITVGEYLIKTEFKNIEESKDKISATAVRTFRKSWDYSDELYNKTYEIENPFVIVKKDDKWYVEQFSYNNYNIPEE